MRPKTSALSSLAQVETIGRPDLSRVSEGSLDGFCSAVLDAIRKAGRDPDYVRRFKAWKAARAIQADGPGA